MLGLLPGKCFHGAGYIEVVVKQKELLIELVEGVMGDNLLY